MSSFLEIVNITDIADITEPAKKLSGWQTSERSWANVAPGLRPGQSIEGLSSEIISFQ